MTAPITDIVNVSIDAATSTPTRAGFGVPLVVGFHEVFTERVREYTDAADLLADGFVAADAIYRAVVALFAQTPRPVKVLVGRLAETPNAVVLTLTPTVQNKGVYTVTINGVECNAMPALTITPTAANDTAYTININGTAYTVTSDADATATEIVTLFKTAINADTATHFLTATGTTTLILTPAAGKTATVTTTGTVGALAVAANTATEICDALRSSIQASAQATTFVETGTATLILTAGVSGAVPEVSYSTNLSCQNTTADAGIATDLVPIRAERDDWYGLLPVGYSKAEILAAAAAISTLDKIGLYVTDDADVLGSGSSDVLSTAKALSYTNSAIWFSRHPGDYLNACIAGKMLPKDPGSATYAHKTVVGVPVDSLSATQRANLRTKNGNWYETVGGLDLTFEGKMVGGRFIDTTIGIDWLSARMQERVLGVTAGNDKIPMTDQGISMISSEVKAQLLEAENTPFNVLVKGTGVVTAPKRSAVTAAERAARTITMTFTGELAGAIHKTIVNGTVTV